MAYSKNHLKRILNDNDFKEITQKYEFLNEYKNVANTPLERIKAYQQTGEIFEAVRCIVNICITTNNYMRYHIIDYKNDQQLSNIDKEIYHIQETLILNDIFNPAGHFYKKVTQCTYNDVGGIYSSLLNIFNNTLNVVHKNPYKKNESTETYEFELIPNPEFKHLIR